MHKDNQEVSLNHEQIQIGIKTAEMRKETKRYVIDTGAIFMELQKQMDNYDPLFLSVEVKEALEDSLIIRYTKHLVENEHGPDYLNRNYTELEKSKREAVDKGLFFFPDFFIHTYLGKPVRLINYGEENVLQKGDRHFDLFFSLRLSQLKLKEVSSFLEYHLETTFENNGSEYFTYLKEMLLIYASILKEATPLVNHYLNDRRVENAFVDNLRDEEVPKLNLQVLALHYIYQELGVDTSTIDMTSLTRLTQFITNRQVGMDPKNTRIYKFLKKPLHKRDEEQIKDLQEIRTYFESVKVPSIVARINREIAGLQVG